MIEVVNLQQIDLLHVEAQQRLFQRSGTRRHRAEQRSLGGEKQVLAVAQFLDQLADDNLRLTVAEGRIHDLAAELRQLAQYLAPGGELIGCRHAVLVGTDSDDGQFLARGGNGLGDQRRPSTIRPDSGVAQGKGHTDRAGSL